MAGIWHKFVPGCFQSWSARWDMPELIDNKLKERLEISFPMKISAAYSGAQSSKTSFGFIVQGKNAAAVASGSVTWIHKTFNSSDPVNATTITRIKYTIAYAAIQGKELGKLRVWFQMLSDSTGPNFLFGQPILAYRVGGGTQGFAYS